MADVKQQPEDCLLSYKQVAEFLNVGKSTVYQLASRGELPCVRVTGKGCTRFRLEDLRAFVKSRVRRRTGPT